MIQNILHSCQLTVLTPTLLEDLPAFLCP